MSTHRADAHTPVSALLQRHWWETTVTRVVIAALVVFIAVCVWWRVQGGQWQRVETPSMGTVAPVGSLLWVHPVDFADLDPGDFITFVPPDGANVSGTVSHRVLERHDDGTISTKGVIPGPDPWRLGPDDVVGKVWVTWRGVGWLVAAAPVLLVGGLLVAGIRQLLKPDWRRPSTLVLASLVAAVAITVYEPLIGADQLGVAPEESGGAQATYVGTGMLPIRLEAPDGDQVVIGAGEVGSVHVSAEDRAGLFEVRLGPALPWWWWAPILLGCLAPALATTIGDLSRRRGSPGRASAAGCHRRPRASCP